MKIFTFIIVLLVYFNSSAQFIQPKIYPNIYELNGFEDINGNSNLFYRINSKHQEYGTVYVGNNLNHLNAATLTDSVFLSDYVRYNQIYSEDSKTLLSFDFWNNDPGKLLFTEGSGAIDYVYGIHSYFAPIVFSTSLYPVTFVSTYKNDDTTFAFVKMQEYPNASLLIKYIGHYGEEFFYDTLGTFNAISHSPYNDNIYFGYEEGILYKSVDEGNSKYAVDNTPGSNDNLGHFIKTMFYDKNPGYIYRIARNYMDNRLMVSDNAGEPLSWTLKHTSQNEIYISSDASIEGLLYMGDGREIYKSTDFGSSFAAYKTLDGRVTGLYKKSGTDKLYASTPHKIYEITNTGITVIKTLLDNDQLKFDPLEVGNKWVYNGFDQFTGITTANYTKIKEVVKDTLINNKTFKKISYTRINGGNEITNYEFQRIDAATGLVYLIDYSGNEYVADDLNITIGDTIGYSRYFFDNEATVLNRVTTFNKFNTNSDQRDYTTTGTGIGYNIYSLANL